MRYCKIIVIKTAWRGNAEGTSIEVATVSNGGQCEKYNIKLKKKKTARYRHKAGQIRETAQILKTNADTPENFICD